MRAHYPQLIIFSAERAEYTPEENAKRTKLFQEIMDRIGGETLRMLFRLQLAKSAPEEMPKKKRNLNLSHGNEGGGPVTVRRKEKKVGRNDPCPCGSGKKYKKCCGVG